VQVAHVMEDCFVAAQEGLLTLHQPEIDLLLAGVDLLSKIGTTPEDPIEVGAVVAGLQALLQTQSTPSETERDLYGGLDFSEPVFDEVLESALNSLQAEPGKPGQEALGADSADRYLRITAHSLNRLLGLAGEALVESRWPGPFADKLLRLKRMQADAERSLGALRESLGAENLTGQSGSALFEAIRQISDCRQFLNERLEEIDRFDRRSANLSHRLYREVLDSRMRPFADGVKAFPRMVRDLARSLGKEARLEIIGEATEVDREVLAKLEAPLTHLLRNAIDHGIEKPKERSLRGKTPEGVIRLEARHASGTLLVIISDDGAGIDLASLRATVVAKKLATPEMGEKLSETELLDFLFLPGFTLKQSVTEISGRGVGLDVVQAMLKQVRGTIHITANPGDGARFQLQLPLTLSVLRTLLVEVAGEAYAFPLAQIHRALKLRREKIDSLEGRQHFALDGRRIGLVSAHQVFQRGEAEMHEEVAVVVLGDRNQQYGLVVDRFLGEQELVVQALDPRLGAVRDIAAAAIMANGAATLIVDVEGLIHSVDKLVTGGLLSRVEGDATGDAARKSKRVLIVDDSLTVRELERKLLSKRGYEVQLAVDGMDGWNAARMGDFDLIITDVDMPRMDGIELVTLIKRDPRLRTLPTMIVSYKDQAKDRQRGLEAGADYYLTKSSFHDETLLQAVVDLIGEPGE